MSDDQQQLRRIFTDALEIPDARRRADYLAFACGVNLGLRERIEELIAAHAAAGSFLGGDDEALRGSARDTPSVAAAMGQAGEHGLGRFGDYELLEEIARGGMGVVYKANQASLDRVVAVKLLLLGQYASDEFIHRFRIEASAAASLQHPNIVAIHEVGVHKGQHYFAMDFVDGPNLAQLVGVQPLAAKRAAGYVRTIAEAIHFAHNRRILHRDLKPSNVLIDPNDQPRVTDFGLAKNLGSDSDLTVTGQVMGSPGFMPPEQSLGEVSKMGPVSDVYSLGAILYYALTARAPFVGETMSDTLRQVQSEDPISPRVLAPSVSADLETICLKCLEKEPNNRFPSAQALADELGRFLRDEPIQARPVSRAEHAWRWCRRKPAITGLAISLAMLLIAIAVGSTLAAFRIARESQRARKAELEALEKKGEAAERLWDSYLAQARANRLSGRSGQRFESLDVLKRAAEMRPSLELRNEAIACFALADLRVLRQSQTLPKWKAFVCLDDQLDRYAVADESQSVRVYSISNAEALTLLPQAVVLPDATPAAWSVAKFSPNGASLAVRCSEGRARLWDLIQKRPIMDVPLASYEGRLDFSPDSRWLATSDTDLTVRIYDLVQRREFRLDESPLKGGIVRFDPTGKLLAVSGIGGEMISILAAFSGNTIASLNHAGTSVIGVAWHPDGRHLATACANRLVYVWDIREGEIVHVLKGHDREVASVAFNHSGDLLASAGFDRTTRIWDFKSARELVHATGGGFDLRFSPDDQRLGCHSWEGNQYQVFDVASARVVRSFHQSLADSVRGFGPVGFAPDGTIVGYSSGNQLKLWDLRSGEEMSSQFTGWLGAVIFDAAGQNLFLSGLGGVLRWPVHPNQVSRELDLGPPVALTPSGDFGRAALSFDGKVLAVVGSNRCQIFHADSPGQVIQTEIQPWMRYVAVHPEGTWIATGAWGREGAKVWEGATGRLCKELHTGSYTAVTFSPDGRWLVTGSENEYRFWKVGQWTPSLGIAHDPNNATKDSPSAMAFSSDGKIFALTDPQTTVRLIDPESGQEYARLEAEKASEISSLAFSPDAESLAVGAGSDALHVWDLRAIGQRLAKIGLGWDAQHEPPPLESDRRWSKVRFLNEEPSLAIKRHDRLLAEIPVRDSQTTSNLIDLSEYYNAALTESWSGGEGNSLSSLPVGVQTLKGVMFDVRGVVQLSGGSRLSRFYPSEIRGVRVGLACRRLHSLLASTGGGPFQTATVGHYLVRYIDGSTLKVPIDYGLAIRDWWDHAASPHADTEKFLVAWTGSNPKARETRHSLRLFKWTWDNPYPKRDIVTLDFISGMTGVAPFLVAITAEP
ncbi:MAG: protein kinase [Verrucomicrobia bacterium]|nr:protein kinase [Verrucomicrobiota bacterium]